jgi:hypothetical protein
MVEWEVQETVVLCVAKYSRRNGGVVGMPSDTMAAKLRWMSCRLLIGWLDYQSDQPVWGLVTMLRSVNSPTHTEY